MCRAVGSSLVEILAAECTIAGVWEGVLFVLMAALGSARLYCLVDADRQIDEDVDGGRRGEQIKKKPWYVPGNQSVMHMFVL